MESGLKLLLKLEIPNLNLHDRKSASGLSRFICLLDDVRGAQRPSRQPQLLPPKWGKTRPKKVANQKTPCWPYARPVMRVASALRQQWYRNMAVSTARRPAANAPVLVLTFLTVLINHHSVADAPAGASTPEEPPHRRFEYKYSFKGPHLSQSDGSVPFWTHTGSKFVSSSEHHKPATQH